MKAQSQKAQSQKAQLQKAQLQKALLQKDRPWLLGFLVAGILALAFAIAERSFVGVFVVPTGQYEALFHVAWIAGLLLGATAACFDEVLGTREFLRQRPVAPARLASARLVGCTIVLVGWMLLPPPLAWLGFAPFDVDFLFGYWNGLPELWGTLVVAFSACGIGCFAGALPAPWWLRLGVAGALFLGTFQGIDNLAFRADRLTDPGLFVGGHLAVAACLLLAAQTAMLCTADADRPWPPHLRLFGAGLATVALTLVWLLCCAEGESRAVALLHRAYPSLAVLGNMPGGGEIVLLGEAPVPGAPRPVVDAAHRPTGRVAAADMLWLSPDLPLFVGGFRGIERPRWSDGGQWTWVGSYLDLCGRLLLATDGAAWWWPPRGGGLQRTGGGEAQQAFAPGSELRRLDTGKSGSVMVVDAASKQLWRFDSDRRHFVNAGLPGDDRFVRFVASHDRAHDVLANALRGRIEDPEQVDFVQGESSLYVWQAGAWQAVAASSLLTTKSPPVCTTIERDSLLPVFEVESPAGGAPFRHAFAPHTAWEHLHATTALLWSALRPPVVQVAAHTLGNARGRQAWLEDPLVAEGRRPWLVLAGLACMLLLAWCVRRRLRGLRIEPATVRFWTASTLLLGPAAALASIAFERPRAHADRALAEPFAAPRIFTPMPDQETVA